MSWKRGLRGVPSGSHSTGSPMVLNRLAWREPAQIAGLLETQPPQLIAAVISQLPRDVAAAALEVLPGKTRADTLLSLAHSDAPDADTTKKVQAAALKRGLLLLTCGVYGNVIRFLYPLTIPDAQFEAALQVLGQALQQAAEPVPA